MADVDHGTITPTNGPGSNRGNHVIQGIADFANAAAREAFTVLAADVGMVARQTDVNDWYIAVAAGTGADKWQIIGDGSSANVSGVITGMEVTVNGGDPAKVDVAAGTGIIWDWSTPGSPVITSVTYAGATAVTLTGIATDQFTTLYVDSTGTLNQQPGAPITATQRREQIPLQTVAHNDFATVTSISGSSQPAYDMVQSMLDYVLALGPVNTGNVYSAASTDLTIDKAAGTTTLPFINRAVDTQNPTVDTDAAETPVTDIVYSYQDGVGGFTFDTAVSDITPGLYDDGSGTPASVSPTSRFTIQRMYYFGQTGSTVATYGQALYNSIEEAEAAIFTESPVLSPQLGGASFTTALIVQGNTTDLSDSADAKFVTIDLGAVSAGGTGAVTSVASGDTDLLTAAPATGDVVLTPTNQEIDTTGFSAFYGPSAGNTGTRSGTRDVGFGRNTLENVTTGSNNTAIGQFALNTVTTQNENTAVGSNAGANKAGAQNTLLGAQAGNSTSGDGQVIVGFEAGFACTADNTVAVGTQAFDVLTTGARNTGVGFNVGGGMTTQADCTFIGHQAGLANTASENTAVGSAALDANTSGSGNTAVGYNTLSANSTGSNNTALGHNAGQSVTGSQTTFIGAGAGSSVTTAGTATGFGYNALSSLLTGNQNTAVGSEAGRDHTGTNVAFFGFRAGKLNTANNSTAFGSLAFENNVTGVNCVAVGSRALRFSTADNNTAIGYQALEDNTSGADNTAIGMQAGNVLTTNSDCTFIGSKAGLNCTAGEITAIGSGALEALTNGNRNTAIGFNAGDAMTTQDDCTFVGHNAGTANTSSEVTGVGSGALAANTSGLRNTAVGYNALNANTSTNNATAVGHEALLLSTGGKNTAVGTDCLSAVTSGNNNTGLGYQAGLLSTGSDSVFLGNAAGDNLTTGDNNIMIGSGVDGSSATVSDEVRIGDAFWADHASSSAVRARIGGSGAVDTSTILDLNTTTTGAFRLPNMTTTQRNALTAANGMMIYNTTTNAIEGYENGSWVNL